MGSRQERNWVMPIIISIIYLNVAIDTVEWRPDPVLGFRKELDSFKQVLLSICVTAEDFSPLRVLSECCNNVCVEFVRNAWSQSGDLASFKNWPSVRSKGLDIGGITQLLARVRSVLQIFDDLVRAISNLEYQGYQMKDMEKYDASTATPAIPETRGLPMGQFLCNDIADNRSISADQLADLQAWPAMILKLC
ncbi:hypothetical protein ColTof3_08446 [Colletotrichum tofieldiae]|nr:hypothetical protein ColTof3_08446 [Colletotrichum tofieldiae]